MNLLRNFSAIILIAAAGISSSGAQSITPLIFPGIINDSSSTVPGAHGSKTPYIIRAKLSGLSANTWYRYMTRAVLTADTPQSKGSGTQVFINQAGTFRYGVAPNPNFFNPLGFDSLRTDSSGEFTGWFGLEARADARFAASLPPPNTRGLRVRIILNNGTPGNTVATHFLTTSDSMLVIKYGTGLIEGTAIYSLSGSPAKEFVFLYGETSGSSRPISGTVVESEGINFKGPNPNPANYPAFYKTNVDGVSGAWGTIVPNLPSGLGGTGIKRIERRKFSDGTVAYAHTDADGIWPTGNVNTVGPAGGASSPLQIAFADAPLADTNTHVGFSVKQIVVAENIAGGSANFNVNISFPKTGSYTVDVEIAGGNADPSDYFFTSPANIAYPFGSGAPQPVSVVINNDCLLEGNDTLVLRLTNPGGGVAIGEDSLIYIIITNDDDPAFSFAFTRQQIKENQDSVMLTVNLNCPQPGANYVDLVIGSGGNAAWGSDFTFFPLVQTLNFPAGITSQDVWIPIINDNISEPNETFFMKLQNAVGGAVITKGTDTIIIINDDFTKYKIGQIHGENGFGQADSNGVRVSVSGIVYGFNLNTQPGPVQFTIRDRTGGIGVFGNAFGYTVKEGDSVEVWGQVGQARGYTRLQNLDTIIYYSSGNTLKAATIIDTLNESRESDLVQLIYARFANPPFLWPVNDTVTVINMMTNRPVKVFVDGETDLAGTSAPSGFFKITGLGWQLANPPNLLNGYRLVPRYIGDVEDLPPPVFSIDSASAVTDVPENGTATFRVSISDAQPVDVHVDISASGTATSADYSFTSPQTITFPANSTASVTLNIPITDDNINESTETIILSLSNPDGGGMVTGGDKTFNIIDNDHIGISEILGKSRYCIYPNPAKDELLLRGADENALLTIFSMHGKEEVLVVKRLDPRAAALDISNLTPGIYLMKVQDAEGIAFIRFIKQ
jgi:hypothetical protein